MATSPGTLDRLRRILAGGRPVEPPPARRELVYEPLSAAGDPVRAVASLPALRGARSLDTPFGPACVIEQVVEGERHHGRVRVAECATCDAEALGLLAARPCGALASGRARPAPVFLDLETTGLHGGAGTLAFLVGLGRFEADGSFRTQQFFLGGFSGERAMLHAVADAVADATLVVTYNGGTFDLPMMETRWLFHRLDPILEGVPHLDMLPPARRLWRETLSGGDRSCRLVALEEALLGFRREGDVPGFEIPGRYFEYLRTGDPGPLEPVLEHNRLDLLSLAALVARAQRLVRDGPAASADARECLALGRMLERGGRLPEAETAYREAARHPVSDRETRELAWQALARLLRRQRRFADAADAWRELLRDGDRSGPRGREAIEALAIHHEHRERNLRLARALAARALLAERDTARRRALEHRIARLDRKLEALRRELADGGAAPRTSPLPWRDA